MQRKAHTYISPQSAEHRVGRIIHFWEHPDLCPISSVRLMVRKLLSHLQPFMEKDTREEERFFIVKDFRNSRMGIEVTKLKGRKKEK